MSEKSPRVGIIMGSKSDWPVMEAAKKMLDEFGVASEVRVSLGASDPRGRFRLRH